MSDRATKAVKAARLRAGGLKYREIAEQMGLSISYAQSLVKDPEDAEARARKASYRGVCEDCGAATDGSNGRGGAPLRCVDCHNTRYAERNERIIAAWERGDKAAVIAAQEGMAPSAVGSFIDRERRLLGRSVSRRTRAHRELWPVIVRRWDEGATGAEIAAECGTNAANVYEMVRNMRKAGVDMPSRRKRRP